MLPMQILFHSLTLVTQEQFLTSILGVVFAEQDRQRLMTFPKHTKQKQMNRY